MVPVIVPVTVPVAVPARLLNFVSLHKPGSCETVLLSLLHGVLLSLLHLNTNQPRPLLSLHLHPHLPPHLPLLANQLPLLPQLPRLVPHSLPLPLPRRAEQRHRHEAQRHELRRTQLWQHGHYALQIWRHEVGEMPIAPQRQQLRQLQLQLGKQLCTSQQQLDLQVMVPVMVTVTVPVMVPVTVPVMAPVMAPASTIFPMRQPTSAGPDFP